MENKSTVVIINNSSKFEIILFVFGEFINMDIIYKCINHNNIKKL